MISFGGPAHFALSALILLWNTLLAVRITRVRSAPPRFHTLTALSGLLIIPALFIAITTTTLIYGRSIYVIAWMWPLTLVLFAAQSGYATSRRLVSPLIGAPVFAYDVLIAIDGLTRYVIEVGGTPPGFMLSLRAAQLTAFGLAVGTPALASPLFLQLPIMAPAFTPRWRASATARGVFALLAAGTLGITLFELPRGIRAIDSYDRYSNEPLQERSGDFTIGMRLFPAINDPPPPIAVRSDMGLRDTIDARVVSVMVRPGATPLALDSVERTLEPLRADSILVIVMLDYPGGADAGAHGGDTLRALRTVDDIMRRMRPDMLVAAVDPMDPGTSEIGARSSRFWESYLARTARLAHQLRPRTQVGVALGTTTAGDSALYAWAASGAAPMDIVGFSLYPSFGGASSLDARARAAERWMHTSGSRKPHWIFAGGAYPLAHGEDNDALATWGALAWATSQPMVKGFVVSEAADYDQLDGMRAPSGRLRARYDMIVRAMKAMREGG